MTSLYSPRRPVPIPADDAQLLPEYASVTVKIYRDRNGENGTIGLYLVPKNNGELVPVTSIPRPFRRESDARKAAGQILTDDSLLQIMLLQYVEDMHS